MTRADIVIEDIRRDPSRFWDKVMPVTESGCWIWMSGTAQGYGLYGKNMGAYGKAATALAHRCAWIIANGPIPSGMELDHKCRVRSCVNPDHLEPVTHKVNINRGSTGAAVKAYFASITHCPQGHEYTADNTYSYPPSSTRKYSTRICKACLRLTPEQKADLRARLAERRAA